MGMGDLRYLLLQAESQSDDRWPPLPKREHVHSMASSQCSTTVLRLSGEEQWRTREDEGGH